MILAPTPVPWQAPASAKVVQRSVSFTNAGATLHGTLYVPVAEKPVPAVVVLHGASEPLASTPLYAHLRDGLPQLGIAVLLYDRRGSGASTGTNRVPYETLAADGIAGARAIARIPGVDPARIGYWGISQGGWLAIMAAARDERAAFVVAVSAPLVTPDTQMRFAMSNWLRANGYGDEDVARMLAARTAIENWANGRSARSDAVTALATIENEPWFASMYLPSPSELPPDPALWHAQMDDDPSAPLANVRVPVLAILGAEDPWIPVQTTVARLNAMMKSQPNLSYTVIPGANHLMMVPPVLERMNDATAAAVSQERPNVPGYFMVLASWLRGVLGGS